MTLTAQHPASIEASGWSWTHVGRRSPAVSGLDLRIAPGERVLLLGASGAGKSTLLQALAGVLGGEDEGDETGRLLVAGQRAARARGRVGLVLQDPDSQVILARVGDDVAFGCENLGVPREEIWRRVREALGAVGLDVPLDTLTGTLSGGQKQRLALAGVLAMRPGLLLLDEPTANLDPAGVEEVRDAVATVLERTGSTFIVIEHRVEVWQSLVDRVVVLAPGGRVLADGAPGEVMAREGARLAASGVWVPGLHPAPPVRGTGQGEVLVQARDVDLPFGLRSGIQLEARAGGVLAVTGSNGAGKTTLGLAIAGLTAPAGGEILAAPRLAGELSARPIDWKSRQLVTRIGSVFQNPEHQFLTGSVREELAVGPRAIGQKPAAGAVRIDELVQRLRLDRLLDANPFTLSGGEKRRLSVASALVTSPPVIVLDEPTFGQDSRTWRELVALLAELADAGTGIIAITHDRAFVDAIANTEFVLERPRA